MKGDDGKIQGRSRDHSGEGRKGNERRSKGKSSGNSGKSSVFRSVGKVRKGRRSDEREIEE